MMKILRAGTCRGGEGGEGVCVLVLLIAQVEDLEGRGGGCRVGACPVAPVCALAPRDDALHACMSMHEPRWMYPGR